MEAIQEEDQEKEEEKCDSLASVSREASTEISEIK
jgi:hypothetical protein